MLIETDSGAYRKFLEDFMDSGESVRVLKRESVRQAKSDFQTLKYHARKNQWPVKVFRRGNRIFVYRDDL